MILTRSAWRPPPIFDFLRRLGTTRAEMYKVFNMGIGYIFIVRPFYADVVMRVLRHAGEQPFVAGGIQRGTQRVLIK